jgi:6-methylsalicylate decarboxylase
MPTYDLHQHLWPPSLVAALRARDAPPRLRDDLLQLPLGDTRVDMSNHDLDTRLEALDRDGIDVAVISCPPSLDLDEALVEAYHEGVLELVAASGGGLCALAHTATHDGFAGASVSAVDLHDLEALAPLLADLQSRGTFLFVHPGPEAAPPGAPDWWPATVGYTAQMQAAYAAWVAHGIERWPDLRVVFAILAGGAPIQLERMASRGVDTRIVLDENIFLDTASYGERALGLALATYGVDQIVYGSDWPVIETEATLRAVRGFGEAVAAAVCADNPERLLQ